MWSLQQKQKYLRENLEEEQFEQFFEYIQDEVGNFNIQQWTNTYVMELVDQFNNKKRQQNKDLQTSFYHYQAEQTVDAVGTMILNLADNIKEEQHKVQPSMKKHEPQVSKFTKHKVTQHQVQTVRSPQPATVVNNNPATKKTTEPSKTIPTKKQSQHAKIVSQPQKEQSAFDFIDSVFKNPNNKNSSSDHMQFKTYSPVIEKNEKVESPNANHFATNQFWDFGTTSNKGHKTSKPSMDFSQFDFWSQPSSSPQNSKNIQLNALSDKGFIDFLKQDEKPKEKQAPTTVTLSFDDLLMNCETIKGPSPYKKKNAVQEVEGHADRVIEVKSASSSTVSKPAKDKPKKKAAKILYDGEVIIRNDFEQSLKCFPSAERTKLKDPNLRVTIQGHEIVQRTFLMPDYAMYMVKVHPLEITCKRNYQDFEKLKMTLKKLFPGIKLSFLDTNSWFSGTNQQFIKNQKIMLQFFLNDLLKNPEIRNSKIIEDFLTLPDHKKIKRKLEEWDKLEAPNCIEELCLVGGRVSVNLSEQQRIYHENFKRYHSRMNQFIERQQKLTHTLHDQLRYVDATETALIDSAKDMIKETLQFNERVYDLELEKILSTLKSLRNGYVQQNKGTKHRLQLISQTVEPFMKYEKDNMAELDELINTQQSFFKTYLKRQAHESIQKDLPYTSDKIKTFKTGVLQESKHLLVLKYQTGYLGNQLCQEGNRVVESFADKIKALLQVCAQKHRFNHAQALEFWSQEVYMKDRVKAQKM